MNFLDPVDHHITGSMSSTNIKKVILCFTPDTLIATPRGQVTVESLRAGNRIITHYNGMQEIRWMGSCDLTLKGMGIRNVARFTNCSLI